MTNLADALSPSRVVVPLRAAGREAAIDTLLSTLDLGDAEALDRARKGVLQREDEITTGIGRGVAFPHARTDAVTGHHVALGVASNDIDFDAIDGAPCRIVILCVFHPDAERTHSRFIAAVAALLNDDSRRAALAAADSVTAAVGILRGDA